MAIVGRSAELAAAGALLERPGGLHVLVLEGEPGIGKTAIWEAALAGTTRAQLVCRPVEAEAGYAFASLADLLAPVVDDHAASLPEPQRTALDVALLRSPPARRLDRRAVGAAALSLLRALTAERPAVVAIDDVQWLDAASAAALAFALRRLGDAPVAVVATVRAGTGEPLGLERLSSQSFVRLRVGPLSLSALYHLLRERLGIVFPRPTLTRIAEASAGNPLFALELARALAERGARPGPGEPLPVPGTLAGLLRSRVRSLEPAAQAAVLAAALLRRPTVALVESACGGSLRAAEAAGLVELRGERIVFSHPLLATAVESSAIDTERRALHARLATMPLPVEERARHLALSVTEPREDVAAHLADAAREALERGAPDAALELAELAVAATPPSEDATVPATRRLTLADCAFRTGDTGRARAIAEEIASGSSQPARVGALELLTHVLMVSGTTAEALASVERAIGEADGDELLARLHAVAARVAYDDAARARDHAETALALLQRIDDPDPAVVVQALLARIGADWTLGEPFDRDAMERALELERAAPAAFVADRALAALAYYEKQLGALDEAVRIFEELHRAAVEEGDASSQPWAVSHISQIELWRGDWESAERRALEHLALAEEAAQPDQRRQALHNLAAVHAHQGRTQEARAEAEALLAEAEGEGDLWSVGNALVVLGLAALADDDAERAVELLRRSREVADVMNRTEPLRHDADLVEALVGAGEIAEAKEVAARFAERVSGGGRPPLAPLAERASALVASASGDAGAATAALERALALHSTVRFPFDLARTLLVAGRVRRRHGNRRLARDAFAEAAALFADLGAVPWRARAERELRRIPIRRPAGDDLTPTERRIAELVAAGGTTREVAQALFVSPKTVEANLTRIYRKLGISSRAELGARIALQRDADATPKP